MYNTYLGVGVDEGVDRVELREPKGVKDGTPRLQGNSDLTVHGAHRQGRLRRCLLYGSIVVKKRRRGKKEKEVSDRVGMKATRSEDIADAR